MDSRLVAGLRERMDSLTQDHDADSRHRRDAALVLGVLEENIVLREQVDELEGRMGPAAVLPLVERLLRSAGDLLAAVVVSDGDRVDHLLTQVRLAEGRVGYERKAHGG